jgi:hypothetical protein
MGWGLAANWAIVAGSVLLTIGTGAQARANLAEYRDVAATLPEAIRQAIGSMLTIPILAMSAASMPAFDFGAGPETAKRLRELARLTAVWTIIMLGSLLLLTGAAIQLALAYTS